MTLTQGTVVSPRLVHAVLMGDNQTPAKAAVLGAITPLLGAMETLQKAKGWQALAQEAVATARGTAATTGRVKNQIYVSLDVLEGKLAALDMTEDDKAVAQAAQAGVREAVDGLDPVVGQLNRLAIVVEEKGKMLLAAQPSLPAPALLPAPSPTPIPRWGSSEGSAPLRVLYASWTPRRRSCLMSNATDSYTGHAPSDRPIVEPGATAADASGASDKKGKSGAAVSETTPRSRAA